MTVQTLSVESPVLPFSCFFKGTDEQMNVISHLKTQTMNSNIFSSTQGSQRNKQAFNI